MNVTINEATYEMTIPSFPKPMKQTNTGDIYMFSDSENGVKIHGNGGGAAKVNNLINMEDFYGTITIQQDAEFVAV